MALVEVDMVDINDACDGYCEDGKRLRRALTETLDLLRSGSTHEAYARLERELSPREREQLAKQDRMAAAFLAWMALPRHQRRAFWDDTHGKRCCA